MKIFNHPAVYALLTLFAVILLGYRFDDLIPASSVGWAFLVVFLLFIYFILVAIYNWIAKDLLPAWRRRRELKKGGQPNA